jgi:hypothetical protein
MTFSWDGLRADIPDGMEPAVLDRGFVRLAGPDLPVLDLRFGPENTAFDPVRDGRRLLKAAGLDGTLQPLRRGWTGRIGGRAFSNAEQDARLFAVHFPDAGGVAAVLFSLPPREETLRRLLCSLAWTPPEAWRTWRCFDLAFETPPEATLAGASFKPGAFHLEFALRGSRLILDRLAPAGVILGEQTFTEWLEGFAGRRYDPGARVASDGPDLARFAAPEPLWRRLFPWLPAGPGNFRGRARHDTNANRILIVSERGRLMPTQDFDRIFTAYAATVVQG